MKAFIALLIARNREFYRDRAAMYWSLLMPLVLVFGINFSFSHSSQDQFKIGVIGNVQAPILQLNHIKTIPIDSEKSGLEQLNLQQIDLLLKQGAPTEYWINKQSGKGYMLEQILQHSEAIPYQKHEVSGKSLNYIDWVIPGILGMNIMFMALFGVGYVIVRYRKNGVLKRLHATPVTPLQFILAQSCSRLILVMAVTIALFIGTKLTLHFTMRGSYILLFIIALLGSMSMISLSLIISSRISSEELASGVLNLVSWPAMLLSGIWFSLDQAQPFMKILAELFPLTHLINAARAVMLDGATTTQVAPELITLALMSVIFSGIAAKLFRWNP